MSWTFVCHNAHWRSATAHGDDTRHLAERACTECACIGEWMRTPHGYELLQLLGRGGMGLVFHARQIATGQAVALKIVHPSRLGDHELVRRFFAEADAISRLSHPNVVRMVDVGRDRECPYLAMEYVDGVSLASRGYKGPQPEAEVCRLGITLARAMQYVHENAILHRDLKPANILVAADGTVKITDFGLAKFLDEDEGITQTGRIVGTPVYMAPEQVQGERAAIGPATDQYAIGVTLYRLITGQAPFSGGEHLNVLYRVLFELPAAPSSARPGLSPGLEAVVLRTLEKAPADRYPCARALAEDLERFLRGEPVQAARRDRRASALQWALLTPAGLAAGASPVRDVLPQAPTPALGDGTTDASGGARRAAPHDSGFTPSGSASEALPTESLRVPLFEGLAASQVSALMSSGARLDLKAGDPLFAEGDAANGLYLVLSGMIEITKQGAEGPLRLATIQPGEVFGELGLLHHQGLRTASARALVKTALFVIPGNPVDLVRRFADAGTTIRLLQNLMRLLRDRFLNQDRMRMVDEAEGRSRIALRRGALDARAAIDGLNRALEQAFAGHLREPGTLAPGEFAFHQGDAVDGFYYVGSGTLEALDERVTPPRRLAEIAAPCTVGELGFFAADVRTAGLRASAPVSYVRYSLPAFESLTAKDPQQALNVLLAAVQLALLLILQRDER